MESRPSLALHVDVYRTPTYTVQLYLKGRAAWKYTERDLVDSGSSVSLSAAFEQRFEISRPRA